MDLLIKENLFEFRKGLDPIDSLGMGRRKLIKEWLDSMGVENYDINNENIIIGLGDVLLDDKNLTEFPEFIQFGEISGGFYCNNNKLVSLRGCPEVVGYSFWCHNNKLETLEYLPVYIGHTLRCYGNSREFTRKEILEISDVQVDIKNINR